MRRIKQIIKEDFGWIDPVITKIADEGSDRSFFRITHDKQSVVLMVYDKKKIENNYYVHIQEFLEEISVNVPKILSNKSDEGLIFLEDLGDISLLSICKCSDKQKIISLYKSVLDESIKIFNASDVYKDKTLVTASEFNYDLYHWEHEYFIKNYLINYRKYNGDLSSVNDELKNLAKTLSMRENRLIHRDFQSKNIMVKDDKPYLIDFQGLRLGLSEYDLASLLQDPYISLDEDVIEQLLEYFEEKQKPNDKEFRSVFNLCSIQRLLQAIGAFCFLGLKKKKTHFLQYIQPAESILLKELEKSGFLPKLEQIIHK